MQNAGINFASTITMINTDPKHKYTYDAKGKMTCCSLDEKIDAKTGKPHLHEKVAHEHSEDDDHDQPGALMFLQSSALYS